MESTTCDADVGFTPMLPGSEPAHQTQSEAPPRLSRAARKAINRAKRDAVTLAEYAQAEVPKGMRAEFAAMQRRRVIAEGLLAGDSSDAVTEKLAALSSSPPVPVLQTGQERDLRSKEERSEIVGSGVLPRGRPSTYTEEEGDAICAWLQEGGSLRAYCRQTGRNAAVVYGWMRTATGFAERYRRACEDRADSMVDDALQIVDEAAGGKDADGNPVGPTIEGVAAAKLRWEARKWIASKMRPGTYGDKVTQEHTGAISISIGIPRKPAVQVVDMGTVDLIER